MFELNGKYNSCKIFTDITDNETISQLTNLLNQKCISDSKIRIMPDTHAGAGCVIGTTMTIKDKVIPNLVGVDIGCGMYAIKLKEKDVDLEKLDNIIRNYVPSGFSVHKKAIAKSDIHKIIAPINIDHAYCSLGTLGGGNHFIEMNRDKNDNLWLVIHTGSRHLGIEVCKHYQKLAYSVLNNDDYAAKSQKVIAELKAEGRQSEINTELQKLKQQRNIVPEDLAYVYGENFENYIHDMKLAQMHANINRTTIANQIISNMNFHIDDAFQTIHNYIDIDHMILRKGAVSAMKDETLIIPMNMRDGSLICKGKGNADWNNSAPHGAGRLMSRSQAKEKITLEEFQQSMSGIYSTSVNTSTIDESPMAYKPMDSIIENTKDTVDIIDIIKPIYNFKASEA